VKTSTLITVDTSAEAHLIKGKLNNEGIECFLTNENFTNLYPGHNFSIMDGIQIMVDENDLERAAILINEKLQHKTKELVCPYCKSSEIIVGSGGHPLLRLFSVLCSYLAAFPFGTPKPKYFCQRCGNQIKEKS